jgi:hypothetical protein
MKYLNYVVILLISGCINNIDTELVDRYDIEINGVLSQNGREFLPKDNNGYYHLKIESLNQQLHRINGIILNNGNEPKHAELLEWESNLYWWIGEGDTIANITKAYFNLFTGEFIIAQLPPLISYKNELVPTINRTSYSGNSGEFNTVIAPIRTMVGDTMIVKLEHSKSKTLNILNIVLE